MIYKPASGIYFGGKNLNSCFEKGVGGESFTPMSEPRQATLGSCAATEV
jgi:hypothetical protein